VKKYKRNKNEREYIPNNTEKYCGQYPIICRSSWEYKMCQWLDYNKSVLEWSSEGHRIRYVDPTSGYNKVRIYYPDFYAMFKNRKKFIIEVKPEKDTRLPKKKGGKSQKTMLMREHTYFVNQAKFKAAEQYCKKLGMEFVIITEKDLFRGK
jgi:hypothetical protein